MDCCKVSFFLLCTVCAVVAIESESLRENKPGMLIRQKKKVIALKKPQRHHERMPGRHGSFHRSTLSTLDEYSVYTSDNPNGNWKPIPYTLEVDSAQLVKSKPAEVSAKPDGQVGHIERARIIENEQPSLLLPQTQQHEPTGEPFEDYALLHYYIPFEQLLNQNAKPIAEVQLDTPQKPLTLEQIMTAAVEPVAMFQLETTPSVTTTPAPTTTTTTTTAAPPPPSTWPTTTDRTVRESDPQPKDDESAGRYEYEYFVQDNRWGTNFGHKELRDGKQTKGDYEVVLPDGRVQHVQYWSDATGYHASVTYHPLYRKYKQ